MFNELREKYNEFKYLDYSLEVIDDELVIKYKFEIKDLCEFNPKIIIPLNNHKIDLNDETLKYLVFNIGMIEAISYFKCTCSKNIIIESGYISEKQIEWFSKLYYYGLGEFLYVNNINVTKDELIHMTCNKDKKKLPKINYNGKGNLIPIGGGKDSCVSLEVLKSLKNDNYLFMINPKEVMLNCAYEANYTDDKIIKVRRILDKKIIDLNNQGFLNGHTPFSSIVAFISYLTAYIYDLKYIALSNEASANEATVIGTKINHQYSKTFEFENDFNNYTKEFFNIDIKYFSLLRPLTEFQIGMLFSKYEKYHKVFKSCNVGSKSEPWKWCGTCPKCLFVYTILSPYLYKDKLVDIFGYDLFDNKDLLDTFIELLGYSDTKPFECVGMYSEVRYAVSLLITKLDKLPYLLEYYKNNYPLQLETNFETLYNNENNLDEEFEVLLKGALYEK